MPKDDLNAPLIQKESYFNRFMRWVKGATKAGVKGKEIYAKAKFYSVATQSKGERAFATVAKGFDYLDKACTFFPPAKIFSKPISLAIGKANSLLELRSLINTIKSGEVTPLTLESDLINLREALAAEIETHTAAQGSEHYQDPKENQIYVVLTDMIDLLGQQHTPGGRS